MHPTHLVFVSATTESSDFLCKKTQKNDSKCLHADARWPSVTFLTDNNHRNLHKPLSHALSMQIFHVTLKSPHLEFYNVLSE